MVSQRALVIWIAPARSSVTCCSHATDGAPRGSAGVDLGDQPHAPAQHREDQQRPIVRGEERVHGVRVKMMPGLNVTHQEPLAVERAGQRAAGQPPRRAVRPVSTDEERWHEMLLAAVLVPDGRPRRCAVRFQADQFGTPLDGDTQAAEKLAQDALGLGLRRGHRERERAVHPVELKPGQPAAGGVHLHRGRLDAGVDDLLDQSIRSSISRLRAWTTMARDSVVGDTSLSMIRTGVPRRARSAAATRPTGPAPTIRTG